VACEDIRSRQGDGAKVKALNKNYLRFTYSDADYVKNYINKKHMIFWGNAYIVSGYSLLS
jgi:hypothetical protein